MKAKEVVVSVSLALLVLGWMMASPSHADTSEPDDGPVFQLDLKQEVQVAPAQGSLDREPTLTGLIVDARGLDFEPSMSMRLFDPEGNQIYTPLNTAVPLNADYVATEGTAAYATSDDQARSLVNRIGARPQMIRAKRTLGYDLVISAEDAWMLRQTNQVDRFLDNFRVVVIWDPRRASLP